MNSLMEDVVVEAGKNVTLGCPGVTEDSLVLMLEWRANGIRLLEYKSRSTTVIRRTEQSRMSLSLKNYSLQLHPVTAADSGTYECLVNNRNAPEAVIKLIVRDVPDPPERPLVINYTSKAVNISWAPGVNSHNTPILQYVIYTRART